MAVRSSAPPPTSTLARPMLIMTYRTRTYDASILMMTHRAGTSHGRQVLVGTAAHVHARQADADAVLTHRRTKPELAWKQQQQMKKKKKKPAIAQPVRSCGRK